MPAEGTFGLVLQRMPQRDSALALAQVASWRGEDRWFSTAEVRQLYLALRLPDPGNLSATLGRLRDSDPAYLRDGPSVARSWAVTPEGEERARVLIGDFDYGAIAAELQAAPGALFAHVEYPTLPHTMAPPAWAPGIKSFVDRHPFERNVFLMTRFPDEEADDDPLGPVMDRLRAVVEERGLALHVASDQQIVDDLWGNVGAHMWACRYGIGILETRAPDTRDESDEADGSSPTLNDNVLIELGSMLTIGRRCMILKDEQAPMPPTDLTSHIFKEVDLDDLDAVGATVDDWIVRDLRLG